MFGNLEQAQFHGPNFYGKCSLSAIQECVSNIHGDELLRGYKGAAQPSRSFK